MIDGYSNFSRKLLFAEQLGDQSRLWNCCIFAQYRVIVVTGHEQNLYIGLYFLGLGSDIRPSAFAAIFQSVMLSPFPAYQARRFHPMIAIPLDTAAAPSSL